MKCLSAEGSYADPRRVFNTSGRIDLRASAILHPRVLHPHQEKLDDRY